MATETKKGKRAKSTSPETLLKDIRRNTKRIFSSEQKELIVMEGIRGELSVAELCRKYGISDTTYYKWNKEFIEAGKARLEGDMLREATSSEVQELRSQNQDLNMTLAEFVRAADLLERIEHDFVWVANEYKYKNLFPNEMWQTNFTDFKVKGFGWYYLSTVLDDYSRYIITLGAL